MAARASRASTPDASAATAAISALDWLKRPGSGAAPGPSSRRPTSARAVPSAATTSVASGSGRAKPQPAQDQPPSVKAMRPSQDGQPTASCCQRRPAPTQCTSRAAPAPHTTSGSSAFATTCVCGAAASAARQLPAIMRTSLVRSSWSRERFSKTHGGGRRRGEHARQVHLVGLEHGAARLRPGQRGHVSRRHVRTRLVAHDGVAGRAERHREQPGRRGLPVGARDERDLAPRAQVLEQPGVEPEAGPAAGHGALAAPEATRRGIDDARRGAGELCPHRGGLLRASSSAVGS